MGTVNCIRGQYAPRICRVAKNAQNYSFVSFHSFPKLAKLLILYIAYCAQLFFIDQQKKIPEPSPFTIFFFVKPVGLLFSFKVKYCLDLPEAQLSFIFSQGNLCILFRLGILKIFLFLTPLLIVLSNEFNKKSSVSKSLLLIFLFYIIYNVQQFTCFWIHSHYFLNNFHLYIHYILGVIEFNVNRTRKRYDANRS